MKGFVGITDRDWVRFLSAIPGIDEVNFWKPGGTAGFKTLSPGEPFLFKLRSPSNMIVGGGYFAHFSRLPCSLAWDAFGQKNGAATFSEFRNKVETLKKVPHSLDDFVIGCILLEQPFFFAERDWFPAPANWKPNIVSGLTYDLAVSPGRELWDAIQLRLTARPLIASAVAAPTQRYGNPALVAPRLGQGSFRIVVTDAYGRQCAMSGEKTLPVLEAAHIKPYSEDGDHRVDNGLLLRSDLHTLYDRGYITVTSEHRIEVSRRIREEFENGRDYYALHGRLLRPPKSKQNEPSPALLDWHAKTVFRG